jgi:hypothetical protein
MRVVETGQTFFDPVTRAVYSSFCHTINRFGFCVDERTRRPVTVKWEYIRGCENNGTSRLGTRPSHGFRVLRTRAYHCTLGLTTFTGGGAEGKGQFTCGAISCKPLHLVRGSCRRPESDSESCSDAPRTSYSASFRHRLCNICLVAWPSYIYAIK